MMMVMMKGVRVCLCVFIGEWGEMRGNVALNVFEVMCERKKQIHLLDVVLLSVTFLLTSPTRVSDRVISFSSSNLASC